MGEISGVRYAKVRETRDEAAGDRRYHRMGEISEVTYAKERGDRG